MTLRHLIAFQPSFECDLTSVYIRLIVARRSNEGIIHVFMSSQTSQYINVKERCEKQKKGEGMV